MTLRSPLAIALGALLLGAPDAGAQGQPAPQTPLRVAASSFASVEVHLNARRIGTQWTCCRRSGSTTGTRPNTSHE